MCHHCSSTSSAKRLEQGWRLQACTTLTSPCSINCRLTETETASTWPAWFCNRSSAHVIAVSLVYLWDSYQWEWVYLWLFCLLLRLFSLCCFALSSLFMRAFTLWYCILLCSHWLLPLRDQHFSEERAEWCLSVSPDRWDNR